MVRIRKPTCCSYELLIVDSRNITGRHPPGNARVWRVLSATSGGDDFAGIGPAEPGDTASPATTRTSMPVAYRRYAAASVQPTNGARFALRIGAGQPWCGGTLSRSQRSRSPSSAGWLSSRSSLVIVGIDSPKILLTASIDGRSPSLTGPLSCDEDHIRCGVCVHAVLTLDIRVTHVVRTAQRRRTRVGAVGVGAMLLRSPSWTVGR